MKTISDIKSARNTVQNWKKDGYTIGLVPTMGFLHEGHASLIEKAVKENDKVVVSIFVNPIQFAPNEDFDKYPRDLQKDSDLCEKLGADLIFAPTATEMYPSKIYTKVDVESLGDNLCGAKRQGHFSGVCTVVSKLFNIINPDRAYFGQKDAQQLAIIKKMVDDLNFDIEIVPCEIVREPSGLAMSSRNSYLTDSQKNSALIISKSLNEALEVLKFGERDAQKVKNIIEQKIKSEPLAKIDYIEIVDLQSLKSVTKIQDDILVAVAVFIGKTRLIDNFVFKMERE